MNSSKKDKNNNSNTSAQQNGVLDIKKINLSKNPD